PHRAFTGDGDTAAGGRGNIQGVAVGAGADFDQRDLIEPDVHTGGVAAGPRLKHNGHDVAGGRPYTVPTVPVGRRAVEIMQDRPGEAGGPWIVGVVIGIHEVRLDRGAAAVRLAHAEGPVDQQNFG